jgi:ABC-type sugar transport system permease subunit/ABC-type glycerol-3-phosphate transport system substrate-binding protein
MRLLALATWFLLACSCQVLAERVELHLWNVPDRSATDPVYVARRRVFEAFVKAHPEIEIKALVPLKIQGPAQQGQEFLAVAGDVAPDVFDFEGRKIADYAEQGFLLPLNEYLQKSANESGQPYSGIGAPTAIWQPAIRGGRALCVPSVWSAMQLDVRSDFFAAAGMDPLRGPRDWDELFFYAMRLTRIPSHEPDMPPDAQPVYGIQLQSGTSAGWRFAQYVFAAGGRVIQPFIRIPGKVNPSPLSKDEPDLWPVPVPKIDFQELGIAPLQIPQTPMTSDASISTQYEDEDLHWRLVTHQSPGVAALEFQRKLIQTRWMRCDNKAWHSAANARDAVKHPEWKGWREPHPREFVLSRGMLESRAAQCPECGRQFDLDDRETVRRIYRGVAYVDGQTSSLWPRPYAMRIMNLEEVNTNGSADFSESYAVPPGVMVQHPFPPRNRDELCSTQVTGRYLGINAAIKASGASGRRNVDAIRAAAWEYIRFVTGPESQKIRVKSYVESGLGHFVRPDLLLSAGYTELYDEIPQRQKEMYGRVISTAQPDAYCRGAQIIATRELNMPLQEIINDPGMVKDCAELLANLSERINRTVLRLGEARPAKRPFGLAWPVFAVSACVVVAAGWKLTRSATKEITQQTPKVSLRRHIVAWLFMGTAVALVLLWQYYPLLRGMMMAFQDYRILHGSQSRWVGFDHFARLFSQQEFYRYLFQTLWYVVLSIGIGFVVPIVLAVMLTEIPAGRGIFRTLYYLPAVTSSLVTLFLWKELLLAPTEQGMLNQLIAIVNNWPLWLAVATKIVAALLGVAMLILLCRIPFRRSISDWRQRLAWSIPAIAFVLIAIRLSGPFHPGEIVRFFSTAWDIPMQGFLLDPSLAMLCIVIPTIWAGAGPGCLIYLAALKTIPDEQYEAADLDGAGLWDKIIHVMTPNLRALIMINLVGAFIGAFQASDNILVMTGGGPIDRTETLGLHIWFQSFLYLNFGYATAAAWVLGAMVVGLTLVQLRTLRRVQFQGAMNRGR